MWNWPGGRVRPLADWCGVACAARYSACRLSGGGGSGGNKRVHARRGKAALCVTATMSGVKRKIEDHDPDYEDISVEPKDKRRKDVEQNAREATVQKIEAIIKEQFSMEVKNKEHQIKVIEQRLNKARRMMDKLRALLVANYYAKAAQPKSGETGKSATIAVLNHPAIKRFLESPSRSSSPPDSELLSQHAEGLEWSHRQELTEGEERRPGRNVGKDTFGVVPLVDGAQRVTYHSAGDDSSRLYVKKTLVVGNVSKYIPPDKREENDQSTHKWMVYVRGSRREPSIDHFVKKVWFFLHPSYKPNDLVEVSEPPFHLTRRGWGEFPVRVQVHFKDPRNKRIDIIHNLKLDRTYTGLQTLGAETVVDVELHRSSLEEDLHLFPLSSQQTSLSNPPVPDASPSDGGPACLPQDTGANTERGVSVKSEVPGYAAHPSERTPTRPKAADVTLGSHGNSAFQPITASCKIGPPSSQASSACESPGKSFQPITMSCKIVSGSPISTPSQSPLPRTPTSTPVHMKHGSSLSSSPYIIVDKSGSASGATAGSPAAQGTRSPAPKITSGGFLSSGVKVIIKQEPAEVPTHPPPQQQQTPQQVLISTATPAQPPPQQLVAVKGGHMITLSPQKPNVGTPAAGTTQNKVVGVPVSSALHSAVKQVAVSSGQILVAKSSPAVSKAVGQKQVTAQGVAKAIVGGASASITGQQVHTVTKATNITPGSGKPAGQGSVMATLQLPANNLANLANLPPGTKLYLTTNSKNPSGKGKLLLIPQGAILRASNPSGQQTQATPTTSSQATPTSSSSLASNLSYTSYILKQTPQGTFLVGQPLPAGSGKPGASASGTSGTTQQAIRVTAGQKATILAQVVSGSQGSQVKLSDGSLKAVTQLSKPAATTLRMSGGVITAASSSLPATAQQPSEGSAATTSSTAPKAGVSHQVLVAAGQAAVKSAIATAKGSTASPVAMVTVAKTVNMPLISLSKGAGSGVVGLPKSCGSQGVLKIQSAQSSSQQTVLTIPANQLKQLGVSSTSGGVQTILMPVSKVVQSGSVLKTTPTTPACSPASSVPPTASPAPLPVVQVKTEPGVAGSTSDSPVTGPAPDPTLAPAAVKEEQGTEVPQALIDTEHIENMLQLLTAAVKKYPLIVPEKTEDSPPFCAVSVEQYHTWNIGKRRAAEHQRAVSVKRLVQDVLEKTPALQALSPPRTREVVQWCRQRGYTPPEPQAQRSQENVIEDMLTQIDSELERPSTLRDADDLCMRLEELEKLLKTEPEDELLDIVGVQEPAGRARVKQEREDEEEREPRFYTEPSATALFVRDVAQQIGVFFQQLEVERNAYAPVVEEMIVKAMQQFASDALREALANAYLRSPQNRPPGEITVSDVHQAVSNIPACDFLTNKYMGVTWKKGGASGRGGGAK